MNTHLIADAVRNSRDHSESTVWDKLFSVWFRRLVYTQIWEDPEADLAAQAVDTVVPEHAPQTEADVEAEELANSTPEQQRPAAISDPAATEDPEPSA